MAKDSLRKNILNNILWQNGLSQGLRLPTKPLMTYGTILWSLNIGEIGEGTLVEIGLDPIKDFLEKHYLPCQLIRHIHDR